MTRSNRIGAAILTVAVTIMPASPLALAQTHDRAMLPEKHDSNTLHKVGKALQYPFRKAGENTSKTVRTTGKAVQYSVRKNGENTSVSAHEAIGKKSVVRDRRKKKDKVVMPAGTTVPLTNR